MSGETKSQTINEQLKAYEALLDEYIQSIGIGALQHNAEVEDILTISQVELRGLGPEDLGEKSYLLAQYSAFLRKEYNRQTTRLHWAEHELNALIGKEYSNYKAADEYIKYDLVVSRVVNANSVAKALNNIIKYAKGRVLELDGLSHAINTMSKVMIELQQTKRWRK